MLGTINVNRELYIEPNEATWKIVADDATKYLRYSGVALDKYMALVFSRSLSFPWSFCYISVHEYQRYARAHL